MGNDHTNKEQFDPTAWQILTQYPSLTCFRSKTDPQLCIERYQIHVKDEIELEKQKQVFYLRKNNPYIAATYYLDQQSNQQICKNDSELYIYHEKIPLRILDINQVCFPDALHLYSQTLQGFFQLSKYFGYFVVEEDCIGINGKGVVKVWIDSQFQKMTKDLSVISEENMVKKIIEIVEERIDKSRMPNNNPSIKNFIYRESDKLKFFEAIIQLHQYSAMYGFINIPSKLQNISFQSRSMNINIPSSQPFLIHQQNQNINLIPSTKEVVFFNLEKQDNSQNAQIKMLAPRFSTTRVVEGSGPYISSDQPEGITTFRRFQSFQEQLKPDGYRKNRPSVQSIIYNQSVQQNQKSGFYNVSRNESCDMKFDSMKTNVPMGYLEKKWQYPKCATTKIVYSQFIEEGSNKVIHNSFNDFSNQNKVIKNTSANQINNYNSNNKYSPIQFIHSITQHQQTQQKTQPIKNFYIQPNKSNQDNYLRETAPATKINQFYQDKQLPSNTLVEVNRKIKLPQSQHLKTIQEDGGQFSVSLSSPKHNQFEEISIFTNLNPSFISGSENLENINSMQKNVRSRKIKQSIDQNDGKSSTEIMNLLGEFKKDEIKNNLQEEGERRKLFTFSGNEKDNKENLGLNIWEKIDGKMIYGSPEVQSYYGTSSKAFSDYSNLLQSQENQMQNQLTKKNSYNFSFTPSKFKNNSSDYQISSKKDYHQPLRVEHRKHSQIQRLIE